MNKKDHAEDPMVTWMRHLSHDPPDRSHRPLPDPDLIWLKARLLDRQAARERSVKIARWFETTARLLAAFAAYWLGSALAKAVVVPTLKSFNPTLLSLGASLVLVAVTMLAFPIWSED